MIQRREDGSVDFYLKWLDYKYGFGRVDAEHWLGNENIHRLTSQKTYILRFDLEDFEGETRYAEYDMFLVANEDLDYQLIVGDYVAGTAGEVSIVFPCCPPVQNVIALLHSQLSERFQISHFSRKVYFDLKLG